MHVLDKFPLSLVLKVMKSEAEFRGERRRSLYGANKKTSHPSVDGENIGNKKNIIHGGSRANLINNQDHFGLSEKLR